MTRWQGLVQLLHDTVRQGTDAVEQIHQDIARTPLDLIAKVPPLERTAREIAAAQAAVIGATYAAIRGVNEAVGAIAAPAAPSERNDAPATARDDEPHA